VCKSLFSHRSRTRPRGGGGPATRYYLATHVTRHQLSAPLTHTHAYTPSALTLHILCHGVACAGPTCTKPTYFYGGANSNGPCFKRPVYIGCYFEPSPRYFLSHGGNQITIDECAKAAASAGSALFGMQWPNGGGNPVDTTAYCMFDLCDSKKQPWQKLDDGACQELKGEYKSEGFQATYDHHGGNSIQAFYSISGEWPDVTSPAPHGATCGEAPCDTLKVAYRRLH
jgi:hypothetical protein